MDKKVCFIGHRNIGKIIYYKLKAEIEKLIKNGCKYFMMGTHGEFDQIALSCCKELKETYNDITIEIVLTNLNILKNELFCPNYEDIKTVYYDIEEVYYKRRILTSNYKMVQNCDILICYVDNRINWSGAKKIYNYAVKNKKKIINLF